MPGITTFLWFDDALEEAVNHYVSVFPNSSIVEMNRYDGRPDHPGQVTTATFVLDGQQFMGLNGGPRFCFSEAISLFVHCRDQAEVDYYWERLLEGGGEEQACGWLKDRFGLSWQVIPEALNRCLAHPDPVRAKRALEAMLRMKKIDVAALEQAVA
jgi:predicted 3-demethylubiquinone-9 3-methyltransferase (glyoxalase superfamily)